MKAEFHPGFSVYRNPHPKHGLVFVALHSGPAPETPTSRDENAETVASLCAELTGGHLVMAGIPRKVTWGIDFNRDIPDKSKAIRYYPKFLEDKDREMLKRYRDVYGWASKDATDHASRLRIYKQFWSTVRGLGSFYVIMHRKLCRIKNYPSVMDIATFKSKGIDEKILKVIVNDVNNEKAFFGRVEKMYKDAVLLEQSRILKRIERLFGKFDLKKIEIEYRNNIMGDIGNIRKWADKDALKKMNKNLNKRNFLAATRNALKGAPPPAVTMDTLYKGELSHGPRTQLRLGQRNIVMQIEINEFFSRFYPTEAAEIIADIIKKVKSIEKYKSMGISQTQIAKFLKGS